MRTVRLPRELLERIEGEARAAYPDEACGFLFSREGSTEGATRPVTTVEPAPNEHDGERARRFVISPVALKSAEARGVSRGEVVSGFYHSHPDHPALPSAFDAEHAWPWYAYLVVSVDRAGTCTVGAFELESERPRFRAKLLEVIGSPSASPPTASVAVQER
jgi:proteasome lid subunit RPN8/RPN11